MTKKTSILSRIWLLLCVFTAVAFTTLRCNMLLTAYDAVNGFYTNDALHNTFAYPLAVLAILTAVTAYIYIKEGNCSNLPKNGVLSKGASYLSVCVLAGAVVYSFAKAVIPALGGIDAFDLALLAFSVVAMLYYLTIGKKAPFRSLLCIASSLVLLVIVLDLYFDRTVSYTNHSVVLCFATAIFSALTFAAEANFSLGRSAYKRYLSYVSTAITLSFALSVPDIVYFAVSKTAVIADIYFDVIILAFGIYHLARLIEIALYKEEK